MRCQYETGDHQKGCSYETRAQNLLVSRFSQLW